MDEPLRIFIALELPPATRELIAAWQRGQTGPGLRPVPAPNLHVTLAFLGERSAEEARSAADVVRGLEPGALTACLRPQPVPVPRTEPRLLALEVESAAAVEAEAALRGQLRDRGLIAPDARERPWWPHVTVFRLTRTAAGEPPPRVEAPAEADAHAFGFRRIALYRSVLRSEGSSYSRLAANELPQIASPPGATGRPKKR